MPKQPDAAAQVTSDEEGAEALPMWFQRSVKLASLLLLTPEQVMEVTGEFQS